MCLLFSLFVSLSLLFVSSSQQAVLEQSATHNFENGDLHNLNAGSASDLIEAALALAAGLGTFAHTIWDVPAGPVPLNDSATEALLLIIAAMEDRLRAPPLTAGQPPAPLGLPPASPAATVGPPRVTSASGSGPPSAPAGPLPPPPLPIYQPGTVKRRRLCPLCSAVVVGLAELTLHFEEVHAVVDDLATVAPLLQLSREPE